MATEKEAQWVELPQEEVEDILRSSSTVHFLVRIAPHDIPDAVRGYFESKIQRFVVQFRYLDEEEPWKRVKDKSPVTLRIGKHSDRLLGLEIDVNRLKADSVGVRILPEEAAREASAAIDNFVHREPMRSKSKEQSYQVAQKILRVERDRVFRSLTPA